MTQFSEPPVIHQICDEDLLVTQPWLLHFIGNYQGDVGSTWTPTFQNLTEVGTPTITGRYYRLIRRICYFAVRIVPGTNTSATAGTTYIDNFPLIFTGDGICFAVTGNLGDGPGHVVSGSNRIYVPSWSAVTVPLTIIGMGEVQA